MISICAGNEQISTIQSIERNYQLSTMKAMHFAQNIDFLCLFNLSTLLISLYN